MICFNKCFQQFLKIHADYSKEKEFRSLSLAIKNKAVRKNFS